VRAINKLSCCSCKKRTGVQGTDLGLENLATGKLRHSKAPSN
jgi:hypothetical protein